MKVQTIISIITTLSFFVYDAYIEDARYPYSCCEMVFKSREGIFIHNCVTCSSRLGYLCASGSNTTFAATQDMAPWMEAAQNCNKIGRSLPSSDNAELLQNLQYLRRPVWVNAARTLNLNPKEGEETFAFCFYNGYSIPVCPRKPRTVCVHEMTYDTNSQVTESIHFLHNISNSLIAQATATTSHETSDMTIGKSTPEHVALIGGVSGAGILLIIIIIVVVFLFRRSNKGVKKDSTENHPANSNNVLTSKARTNVEADGESLNPNIQASIKIQSFGKESKPYTNRNTCEGFSLTNQDKGCLPVRNDDESMTDVDSMVQMGQGIRPKLNIMKQNVAEEYDKIIFGKSSQVEEEVYDKINFHCESRNDQLDDLYNKPYFDCESRHNDAGNVYDKANFSCELQEGNSGNVYAKSNFHHEHRYKDNGNVYDQAGIYMSS